MSFSGEYPEASMEKLLAGLLTPAITWGHSKDHRPDLKQLLYILTVTNDGGVPIYFQTASGNVTDDQTHQATWQLLAELVGRTDFVYVADCKLATTEQMRDIASRGGRFITILPATRKENATFRSRLVEQPESITWSVLYHEVDEDGHLTDAMQVGADEHEEYRSRHQHAEGCKHHDAAMPAPFAAEFGYSHAVVEYARVFVQRFDNFFAALVYPAPFAVALYRGKSFAEAASALVFRLYDYFAVFV